MTNEKRPRNKIGEPHGYWEEYHTDSVLFFKGNYIDGKRIGYWEWHDSDLFANSINEKEYIII
jgi:hypothetical protein